MIPSLLTVFFEPYLFRLIECSAQRLHALPEFLAQLKEFNATVAYISVLR